MGNRLLSDRKIVKGRVHHSDNLNRERSPRPSEAKWRGMERGKLS
jgi:hypothetical protein